MNDLERPTGWISTRSGRAVTYADPRPTEFDLRSIAAGLSNCCRFAGQISRFYSVAEHAVFVRDLVRAWGASELQEKAAIHHDDHEAYTTDLPSPAKPIIGMPWVDFEDRFQDTMEDYWQLPRDSTRDPLIAKADTFAAYYEAARLRSEPPGSWVWADPGATLALPPGVRWIGGMPPSAARGRYLSAVATLE